MNSQEFENQNSDGEQKGELFEFLDLRDIEYSFLTKDEIEQVELSRKYIKTQLLQDEDGELLIIYSADRLLDYPQICRSLTRELEYVPPEKSSVGQYFDEKHHSYPALPEFLMVNSVIIDEAIKEEYKSKEEVIFSSGKSGGLIKISFDDFIELCNFIWESDVSVAIEDLPSPSTESITVQKVREVGDIFTSRRMKARVNETFEMPIMPPMADELLKLRVDPTADSKSLAKLASKDPSLSAQLVSWACSPYYGYPGKITSIDDAIIKVLGFDLVMNIALGIAIGQVMRVPNDGPLGLSNYWQASVYSSSIIEELTKIMPVEKRPFRGLAYLCGLLHNFGILLLGQVFPPQYSTLNQTLLLNDKFSVESVEQYLFGTNHRELGKWLMEAWHLPEELLRAIEYHNDPHYDGEHAVYPALVLAANRLLYRKGIGFENTGIIEQDILDKLGFEDETKLIEVLDIVWENSQNLDNVIKLLIGE